MGRKTSEDFDQELLDIYDEYAHGIIDRAAKFAVGGITTVALLQSLSPDYALANRIEETDPRINAEMITYKSPQGYGDIKGYLVHPAGGR